jgi:hypothetical protein
MSIKVQILKYAEIVRNSRTMIMSIKMSTINLWTVLNPDESIFRMHAMGEKHPPPKEAEPVKYFSQLSATNEDCLIFYWRQILKIRFSNTWWGIHKYGLRGNISTPANPHWDSPENRTPGTLKFCFSWFLIMIFFTVSPTIFGEVLTARKHVICWNITTYKNMDVKLLHPVRKDFLDTVNTVVLTGYWKQHH